MNSVQPLQLLTRNTLRIVQVEDDDEYALISKIWLRRGGFNHPIKRCNDGAVAVRYLETNAEGAAPDVILLDLNMPHMDGLAVLSWVRLNFSHYQGPIYMLTSSDEPEDRLHAMDAGATKYFTKTALYDGLVQELDQFIATTNAKRQEEVRKRQAVMAELALMGEYAAEIVILTDVEGRVEWVNEPFTLTTGYSLEEVRGKKPGGLLQGDESDGASVRQLRNAVQSEHSCECHIINYKRDGTTYLVHISLGPVLDGGRLHGFLAVEKDLSEASGNRPRTQPSPNWRPNPACLGRDRGSTYGVNTPLGTTGFSLDYL